MWRLTENEADEAAGKVDEAFKEVDNKFDDLSGELERELGCVLDEVGGGGKEGPDELDERCSNVRDGVDDGRHVGVLDRSVFRAEGGQESMKAVYAICLMCSITLQQA